MARKNQQVESRMVSEYLLDQYAQFPTISPVPLGAISDELAAQVGFAKAVGMSRPFRPYADAVVILPNYLLLVEAKVWNVVNGLAKLPLYKSLVPVTPELKQYTGREVLMELVVAWTNSNLEIMAKDAGVRLKVYSPPWLQEVTDRMHNYWTKDYRVERDRKLQMRQTLGLE